MAVLDGAGGTLVGAATLDVIALKPSVDYF